VKDLKASGSGPKQLGGGRKLTLEERITLGKILCLNNSLCTTGWQEPQSHGSMEAEIRLWDCPTDRLEGENLESNVSGGRQKSTY
jgi:hypothetical protein